MFLIRTASYASTTLSIVNIITPANASKLGHKVCPTDVGIQKIDDSTFQTFRMVLVSFQVEDKLGRSCFFQRTLLVAETSAKVVLEMLFLTLNKVEANCIERAYLELIQRHWIVANDQTEVDNWPETICNGTGPGWRSFCCLRRFFRVRMYDNTSRPKKLLLFMEGLLG